MTYKDRNLYLTIAAALWALSPVAGHAEEADEIIVEGTRLPSPLSETGASISVITADDIELRGYTFALDAIAAAPGVTVNQNGALGGLATVRIRGAGTDQTLVLLDGVPLGDPTAVGGGHDFSILDAGDIDRIEILKGPQSTLWGSDAIGGVVNLVSKKPEDGFGATAFAEGGSFNTFRGGAAVSGAGDTGDFRLSASGITSDGISKAEEDDGNPERDAYDGLTFAGRGGLNLPHDIRLEAIARYMEGETEIDGFPPPTFTLADSDDNSKNEQFTASARLIAPLLDGRLENQLMAGFTDIKRTGNFGGFASEDNGDRLILRYQGTLTLGDRHRIAAGAEREENEANGDETTINSLFALYEVKPVDRLTLSAGIRNDDHSEFGAATTFRFAGAYQLTETITLRGTWGEGFKAPTIFQLTQSFGVLPPNGDLQPETSKAFDVGLDFTSPDGRAALSVTYFNRDTENQIIFAPNSRYENLAATEAQGIETALDVALPGNFSLSANYAYIDAIDATTGARQIRTPRHSGDAGLIYGGEKLSGSLIARYNGDETEGPFGSDVEEWIRVDLAASYAISEAIEIYGRIENLLDADYQQVSGYGTPGLSGYAGIRVKL